jgi:fructose/tagatose bisphosphate aldolase
MRRVCRRQVHAPFNPLSFIGPIMVNAANEVRVPVAVHLDHGLTEGTIREAAECQWKPSWVMLEEGKQVRRK